MTIDGISNVKSTVTIVDPDDSTSSKVINLEDYDSSTHTLWVDPGDSSEVSDVTYEAQVPITAAATITLDLNIPANVKIESAHLYVQTALTGGETWDAALDDGSEVEKIGSGIAVDAGTEVHHFSAGVITDATTDILITKNGGGAFTAAGRILAIVRGKKLTWS